MTNGVIPVFKEQGYTSFDVVAKLRGILGIKKIGHTGTLDPMATGVLPVCIGRATKLVDYLTDSTKEYEAVIKLGMITDSYDATGKILQDNPVSVDEDTVREVIRSFKGEYMQIPPMYSAIKINGERLYKLARAGQTVDRKPRLCHINRIEILPGYALPYVGIRVECSKGTYIRSLANDIGEKLGTGACLTELKRTKTGGFLTEDCYTLSEIEEMVKSLGGKEALASFEGKIPFLTDIEKLFHKYPACIVNHIGVKLVLNGGKIKGRMMEQITVSKETCFDNYNDFIKMYSENKELLAIYKFNKTGKLWELALLCRIQ